MRNSITSALLSGGLACIGCTGQVGSPLADDPSPSDERSPAPTAAPGPATVKLLRTWEYRRSITDLLGLPEETPIALRSDLVRAQFSAVSAAADCYDDIAIETRERLARELSASAFSQPPTPLDAMSCRPSSSTDPCLRAFIEAFGARAWRRSLTAAEVDKYSTLLGTLAGLYEDDPVKAAELTVAALLTSPHFLYRVELGVPVVDSGEDRLYTSVEMASRLAFTLWGRAPDAALLALGTSGDLSTAEQVRAQARRMLDDPRADGELARFWREHLNVDRLTLTDFPKSGASEALYRAMRQEAEKLIDRAISPGADALLFLTSDRAYVDASLAELYDITLSGGPGEVALPAQRRGFLTSGLFLATMSHPSKNSPVRRGRFVLDRLLCLPIPSPPADVDVALPPIQEGQFTLREQLSEHVSNPSCRGCHNEMDPIGFSFEHFDQLGRARVLDNGLPIDASGVFRDQPFNDARGLIDIVRGDPEINRCLVRQTLRFLTGHLERTGSDGQINERVAEFEASGREFRSLVVEAVASDTFRYARGLAGGSN